MNLPIETGVFTRVPLSNFPYIFFLDNMMQLDEWHIDVMFDFALAN